MPVTKLCFCMLHEQMQSLNFLARVRGEILNSYSETENFNNVPEMTELSQYSRTSFMDIQPFISYYDMIACIAINS